MSSAALTARARYGKARADWPFPLSGDVPIHEIF
jgi:hypothetical protein